MFKYIVFAAILAVALAAPQPGLVAPVAYNAGYAAAPVAYSGYSGHYTAPVVRTAAYAAPLAYSGYSGYSGYTAPVAYSGYSAAAPVYY